MKASILTFSQTGNTLKAGDAIARGLGAGGIAVEHTRFLRRRRWSFEDAGLIGIGCPVFENRPAECVLRFLGRGTFDLRGKKALVFITSGGSPARSLWRLARAVEQRGAEVVGGVQLRGVTTVPTMFGLFKGRPDRQDLAQAEAFGRATAGHLTRGLAMPSPYRIDPRQGGRLYDSLGPCLTLLKKKVTPRPKCDHRRCDLCGNCAYECPTRNIRIIDRVVEVGPRCIVCYRCWHVCPHQAISIRFSPGKGWIERTLYSQGMERRFGNIRADERVGPNLYREVLARRIRLKYDRKTPTAEFG